MGCGTNATLGTLAYCVVGLDRFKRPGQLCGKMEAAPLVSGSADILVYSLCLYGTATDLRAYFVEAARVLRNGGEMFIVEPASEFTDEGLVRFLEGLRWLGFTLAAPVRDVTEDRVYLKAVHMKRAVNLASPDNPPGLPPTS